MIDRDKKKKEIYLFCSLIKSATFQLQIYDIYTKRQSSNIFHITVIK